MVRGAVARCGIRREGRMAEAATSAEAPRVGLFVTCLVDIFRTGVGYDSVKLLE